MRIAVDDLVGEPDAQRLGGVDLPARDAQLLGSARTDEAGEALRPATAGNDAEEDLRLAEHSAITGDPVVARQRHLAAAAERVAADGGDHEAIEGGDGVVGGMEPVGDRPRLGLPAELVDVGTGGEDPLASGDDDGTREIGGQLPDRPLQLTEQRRRDGVDLAVAQSDHGDSVVAPFEREQLVHRRQSGRRRTGAASGERLQRPRRRYCGR